MAALAVGVAVVMGAGGAISDGAPPTRERVRPPSSLTKRYPLGRERLCCRSERSSTRTSGTPATQSEKPPAKAASTPAPANDSASKTAPAPTRPAATTRSRTSEASNAWLYVVLAAVAPLLLVAAGVSVRRRHRRSRRQQRAFRAQRAAAFQQAIDSARVRRRTASGARRAPATEVVGAVPAVAAASTEPPPSVELERPAEELGGGADAPTATPQPETALRALGYISVPGSRGDEDNLEARAQIAAIEKECQRRGFILEKLVHDAEPNDGAGTGRPGLAYALDRLARGEASVLVVSRLERLSRSIVELGAVFEWFAHSDATLIVVDHALDTSEPAGRLVAEVVMSMSGWERNRLADRTRRGLEAARTKGQVSRPAVSDIPALKNRIVSMREEGMTLQAIADQLNVEGVPTLRGGSQWRPSSVQSAAGYKRPKRSRSVVDLPPPRQTSPNGEDT